MRLLISTCVAVLALAVTSGAQDKTVKSRTEVKADDGKVVVMTGCLRRDAPTGAYLLTGTVAAVGDEVKTEHETKIEVDDDHTTVKSKTKAKADDGAVAAPSALSTFALVPRAGLDLASHLGRRVQLSAVMVKPGHGDAEVKIEEKTRVDPEHGRDSTSRSETKLELPRTAIVQYTAVSVKSLGTSCPAY